MDLVLDADDSDLKAPLDSFFSELVKDKNETKNKSKGYGDEVWLQNRQKAFINRYMALHILKIIEGDDDPKIYKNGILSLVAKVNRACEGSHTKRGLACLYQVFLAMLVKKELMLDRELRQTFQMALNSWPDSSNTFKTELMLVQGSQILQMYKKVEQEDT